MNSDGMRSDDILLVRLRDMFVDVEFEGSADEGFCKLASMAGEVLNARGCAIIILGDSMVERIGLRPGAAFGDLPVQGCERALVYGDRVLSSDPAAMGDAMACAMEIDVVADANHCPSVARDKMFSVMVMSGKVIGGIQTCEPQGKRCFGVEDLQLLNILTVLITKSIQVIQLQNILNSRFAQAALAQATEKTVSDIVVKSAQEPEQMARILAKSFYKEMTKAGFNFNQIIQAASEIISELSKSVRKHSEGHKRRIDRVSPTQAADATRSASAPS